MLAIPCRIWSCGKGRQAERRRNYALCYRGNCPASPSAPRGQTIKPGGTLLPTMSCFLLLLASPLFVTLTQKRLRTLSPFLSALLLLCAENKTSMNILPIRTLAWSKMQIQTNSSGTGLKSSWFFSGSPPHPTLHFHEAVPPLATPTFPSSLLQASKPLRFHLSGWLNHTNTKSFSGFAF